MVLTKLKACREAANMVQEKLAYTAELSRETVAKAESGRNVTITTAAKLAKALKCKVDALL